MKSLRIEFINGRIITIDKWVKSYRILNNNLRLQMDDGKIKWFILISLDNVILLNTDTKI